MRQSVLWIVVWIALFFAGDRVLGNVLASIVKGSQFRYSKLYAQQAAADVLLVGNSRGLGFYQPYIDAATQSTSFNLSYNGMPIDLARTLVTDYLDRYPAPKVLLLEVTMTDRINAPLITGFSGYAPYSTRLDSLIKATSVETWYANQLTHLYRYNNEIFQRAFYHYKKPDTDWLLDRVINDRMVAEGAHLKPTTANIEPYVLKELGRLVKTAQAKGVDVKLIVNPYFPAYAASLQGVAAWKAKITAETGLPIHDYATALTERQYFGDFLHINKKGSEAIIAQMVKDSVFQAVRR